ncbi:MAG TPA: hypothetical protein VGP06_08615, partial [Janthinobacterium sp.]|nr:hypothetical protein [Janthinobacterium sp.]
ADDSAATSVKVGHRQACHSEKPRRSPAGFFYVGWFLPARWLESGNCVTIDRECYRFIKTGKT